MPPIKLLHRLERLEVKVERTTGGAVRGIVEDVLFDGGSHPTLLAVRKNNGQRVFIPWHAVRSLIDETE